MSCRSVAITTFSLFRLSAACSPSITTHPLTRMRNCEERIFLSGNVLTYVVFPLFACVYISIYVKGPHVCIMFLTFANGGSLISLFCFLVCKDRAMYCFCIHNSFNPLQASITQIGKKYKWGLCLINPCTACGS